MIHYYLVNVTVTGRAKDLGEFSDVITEASEYAAIDVNDYYDDEGEFRGVTKVAYSFTAPPSSQIVNEESVLRKFISDKVRSANPNLDFEVEVSAVGVPPF